MGVARNRTIASLVLLLILAACSREQSPASPAATLAPAPSETAASSDAPSETEPADDPYAIPADPKDIDKEYVERVIEALTASIADAVGMVVRDGKVTPAAEAALSATHKGESLKGVRQALGRVAASPGPFRADAEGSDITVKRVITATRGCIFALVIQDTSGLVKQDIDPFPGYYHLATKSPDDDPEGENPTPWMIVADAEPRSDGKEYTDPCG